MCGFAGEFLFAPGCKADPDTILRMARRLRHRGPDEERDFLCPTGRCAMAFERLAVIDPAGSHQPMSLEGQRITIAFNGEIYNFRQLRSELAAEGVAFLTQGDTEVLLHLYRRDGATMVERLNGMFALAIYDAEAGQLFMARDRLGEKPLWYAPLADRVVFASEAKAMFDHPAVGKEHDLQALTYYLTLGYIPGDRSIYSALRKLAPGHFLLADRNGLRVERYWQPQLTALPSGRDEQIELVRHEVTRAVELRMVSDVPLGALLSGGLDSSIVVALMAKIAGKSGGVRTFTAGFDESGYDERPWAAALANHCKTQHTELLIQADPATMLDRVVSMYDEPFADSSALPTFLICQAARQHVTVALAGDGGDEIFGGYDRYRALLLSEKLSPPGFLAIKTAAAVAKIFAPHDERNRLRRLIRFSNSISQPYGIQYFKYRALFNDQDLPRLFTPEFISKIDLEAPFHWFVDLFENGDFEDEVSRAQHHDLMTYLPDDLLVKTDIASMASALELRAPLLDHNLVPLGLSLPADAKIEAGRGKAILRRAFGDLLPAEVLSHRKQGFGVPLGRWLRQELAVQMKDVLLDSSFLNRNIIRKEALHGLINDHLSGRDDHRHRLWALMVLAKWLNKAL